MNREKVVKDNAIRGLQSAIEISSALVHLRKEHAKAILDLLKEQDDLGAELTDAVELIHKKNERIKEFLKEQEAVPVTQRKVMHMLVWCCSSCGVAITDGDKFCRNCGRKMKWDA